MIVVDFLRSKNPLAAGVMAGLTGGVVIWIYEALVWVQVQHLMLLTDIPRNAVGLVFGKQVMAAIGSAAYLLGSAIHFFFAMAWGVLFALIWPSLRRNGIEASLVALFFALLAWIVMHVAISLVSDIHPAYTEPAVSLGGYVSHLFYAVPMALQVKARLKVT